METEIHLYWEGIQPVLHTKGPFVTLLRVEITVRFCYAIFNAVLVSDFSLCSDNLLDHKI